NGQELAVLQGRGRSVSSLAFSPDGKTLAAPVPDGVKLWDVVTGKERTAFPINSGSALAVAWSPDGGTVGVGVATRGNAGEGKSRAGEVVLWDVTAGKERTTLAGHGGPVRAVAFAPDGKTLAAGGDDGVVKLWDPAAGKETGSLPGHRAGVR